MRCRRAIVLTLAAFAMLVVSAARAQECNDIEWYRVGLWSHQGGSVVFFPPLERTFVLDAEAWEWTGQGWRRLGQPVAAPSLVTKPIATAFDPVRGRVVAITGNPMQTWEWDGQQWRRFAGSALPYRSDFALAFDPHLGKVVLVGGFATVWPNPTVVFADMWAWSGTNWTLVPASNAPGRLGHAIGLDPASGRLILHGGRDTPGGAARDDTWAWDGSAWTQIAQAGPADTQRPIMYADQTIARLRMLYTSTQGGPAHLWEWTQDAWVSLGDQTLPPRRDAGADYDPVRRCLIVSGGSVVSASQPLAETWEFDGQAWVKAWDAAALPLMAGTMAYDALRDRIVAIAAQEPDTTLLFDGEAWERVSVPGPAPRVRPAMAFDSARGVVVLHAGVGHTDTWEWNGAAWSLVSQGGPPASYQTMDYDPIAQRCLLVTPQRELWSWDGLNWARLGIDVPVGTGPVAYAGHSVAFDSVRGRLVAHPANLLGRTAEWNGTAWSVLSGSPVFPVLGAGPLIFDQEVGRVLRFGGIFDNMFNFPVPSNYTIEWSNNVWWIRGTWNWNQSSPPAQASHPMIWDSARRRAVFTGAGGAGEMWAMRRVNTDPPVITGHPVSRTIPSGGSTTFSTQVAATPGESLQWYRDGQPLTNGFGPTASITGAFTRTLVLGNVKLGAAGQYHCVVTNDCGTATSLAASLTVICPADLTTSASPASPLYGQPDGRVDSEDFFFYLAAFAQGNLPVADLTTTGAATPGLPGFGVPDGLLDADDFVCFLIRFGQPC